MSRGSWTYVRFTPIHSRGKLTLREDIWRLPTGHEEIYPLLAVGVTDAYLDETSYCYIGEELLADPLPSDQDEFLERRLVPFGEALAMALDHRVTESVAKMALLAAGLKRGIKPGTIL